MRHTRSDLFADSDYDAIESALSGTAKGQWFLNAYLERNRRGETLSLLNAISRLHGVLVGDRMEAGAQAGREIKALVRDITRAKRVAAPLDAHAQLSHFRDLVDHVQAQIMAIGEMLDESAGHRHAPYSLSDRGRYGTTKLFGELVAMVGDEADTKTYDC